MRRRRAEERLWGALRNRRLDGLKFRRQVPIGASIADFVCMEAKLIVEVDGVQHAESPGGGTGRVTRCSKRAAFGCSDSGTTM